LYFCNLSAKERKTHVSGYSTLFPENLKTRVLLWSFAVNLIMMKQTELITNADGSVFHLHLLPADIADRIIIVGDPGRVEMLGQMLDSVRVRKSNREFSTVTGSYRDMEVTIISSGIGTDNIDIVVNELDALANIDLSTGVAAEEPRSLTFIRIGTAGGLQGDIPVGSFIATAKAVGFDGVLHFYEGYECVLTICWPMLWQVTLNGLIPWPIRMRWRLIKICLKSLHPA
jgi:hypothetical protein